MPDAPAAGSGGEARFMRVLRDLGGQLPPDEIQAIAEYIHYSEPGLALEGLVSSLRRHNVNVSDHLRKELAYLADALEMTDYEPGKGLFW